MSLPSESSSKVKFLADVLSSMEQKFVPINWNSFLYSRPKGGRRERDIFRQGTKNIVRMYGNKSRLSIVVGVFKALAFNITSSNYSFEPQHGVESLQREIA